MFDTSELSLILPEIIVATMICVILLVNLFISDQRRALIHMLSMLTLVMAGLASFRDPELVSHTVYAFSDTFVRDSVSDWLKIFAYLVTGFGFTYAKHSLRSRNEFTGEYYLLTLLALLGAMVLISAANLITVYVGLELMALSVYSLIAIFHEWKRADEAAIKYFVLGALASGMLLYGMSFIYGATGTLDLNEISASISQADNVLMSFGLVFIVVGLAFKFGAVPFHMWVPDVYEGSPLVVLQFIGSVPKIAAFGMIYRLLGVGMDDQIQHWQSMLLVLAALSMIVGNVAAIAQTNIKRMLAYSTISHVGFILMGVLAGGEKGMGSAMFYTISYATMSIGTFALLMALSKGKEELQWLRDLRGLNQQHPWYAALMAMLMASMAGIPPFLGFFAKVAVLDAALDA
ncbi:MAG: NADH-quinone oxidoreductase subunit N, partial [bacterium]